ncbi:MAG: HAD family phosphatase [Lachnospiraceae bacterium]|nr:HAD family phosphatase [Lachnospiraceae bacterium]
MKSKKVLIFDFFGVLCSEVAPFWLERYFTQEEAAAVKSDIVGKADIGLSTEDEMMEELGRISGETAEQVREDWMELAVPNLEMHGVLKKLRKEYRLVLLSNAPAEFLERILERDGWKDYFEHFVISSLEGIAKPDPEIYQRMLEWLEEDAEACVMIDDNPKNLDGARLAGIDGVLFEKPEDLDGLLYPWGEEYGEEDFF